MTTTQDPEAERVADELVNFERQVLLDEYSGPWGAALGQAIEALQDRGLIYRKVSALGPGLTDRGRRVARVLRQRRKAAK